MDNKTIRRVLEDSIGLTLRLNTISGLFPTSKVIHAYEDFVLLQKDTRFIYLNYKYIVWFEVLK